MTASTPDTTPALLTRAGFWTEWDALVTRLGGHNAERNTPHLVKLANDLEPILDPCVATYHTDLSATVDDHTWPREPARGCSCRPVVATGPTVPDFIRPICLPDWDGPLVTCVEG